MKCLYCKAVIPTTINNKHMQMMLSSDGNWVLEVQCPHCLEILFGTIKLEKPFYFDRVD